MNVTQLEIADVLADAFADTALTRAELMDRAVRRRARPVLLDLLHDLPEREFRHLRELWCYLPDLPVR